MIGKSVLSEKMRSIAKAESDYRSVIEGEILSYNKDDHTAKVQLTSVSGTYVVDHVPVSIHSFGIYGQLPKMGDIVLMVSAKGRSEDVRIIGFMDKVGEVSDYSLSRKYKCRGEGLVDITSLGTATGGRYQKRIQRERFHEIITSFINVDTIEQFVNNKSKIGSVHLNDVALMNPVSKAIVKIKETGIIEIFTIDDTGILIDPTKKSISFFGDLETKSREWSVLSNSIKIESKGIDIVTDSIKINGREMLDV